MTTSNIDINFVSTDILKDRVHWLTYILQKANLQILLLISKF